MSDAKVSDAADAARFRYLISQVTITAGFDDNVIIHIRSDDLDHVEFNHFPKFRDMVDAMMTNAVQATTRGN
jgi:hypothetical protein